MEDATSFPRGRLEINEDSKQKKNAKRGVSDLLFGEKAVNTTTSKRTKKRRKQEKDLPKNSLLPLGGGAVANSQKGEPYIEALSFSKFAKDFALLAIVKEVHEDLAIFSLPNQWTGYMLRNEKSSYTLDQSLQPGQMISVRVVKAAQETIAGGKKIRRIQVTCEPSKVNSTDASLYMTGLMIRGQVISVEDHGILVDLGLKRRGFLPFDEISGSYNVEESGDEKPDDWQLLEGRFIDFLVRSNSADLKIVPLQLLSKSQMAKHLLPVSNTPTLQGLTPGSLVRATVEAMARNGLCVTFGGGVFRGAIEMSHLGTFWIPNQRSESTEWKAFFTRERSIVARITAVDTATKIVRLSMLPHLLDQRLPAPLPKVGTIVSGATVIRIDPGIGALLALPEGEDEQKKRVHRSLFPDDEVYQQASKVQAVYVHISKALDPPKGKVDDADLAKAFAPSTKHSVRILSTANLVEGVASGGSAESIISAHVLTHADLVPGKIYRKVPICVQLDCGGVLVDFGMGIRGMVPAVHLFDHNSSSEFRSKTRKLKYSVGAKIDVRVLTVNPSTKKVKLTSKPALLKTDDVISSFEGLKIGQRGTGFVSKVDDMGITVTFFNGVYGLVTARSLKLQLGIESHIEAYSLGDVVSGFITNLKKVRKMAAARPSFWEVTFSLRTGGDEMERKNDIDDAHERMVNLRAGTILPSKSLRVLELVNGKEKKNGFVPGYAVVSAKTKYFFDEAECSTLMPEFECKLPYDQLFDNYNEHDISDAAELDSVACQALEVGKKLSGKAIVLKAPLKSRLEYFNATGKLPVVSMRASLVDTETDKPANDDSPFLPSPESSVYVGSLVVGYVAQVDSRYGAFVQFLDELSGMVPKKRGGLSLSQFSTITCRVVGIDTDSQPMKLLLDPVQGVKAKTTTVSVKSNFPFAVGDLIEKATVAKVGFSFAVLSIGDKYGDIPVRIHCTMVTENRSKVKKSVNLTSDTGINEVHPFYGWVKGKQLTKLTVISLEESHVEVSLRPAIVTKLQRGFAPGKKVVGVVSKDGCTNHGYNVMLSPQVNGYLDALEISSDVSVLRKPDQKYVPGSSVECFVLDGKPTRRGSGKSNVVLSVMNKSGKSWVPAAGSSSICRVQLTRSVPRPPALMTCLRGGFYGRCCITELDEKEKWLNLPLGSAQIEGTAGSSLPPSLANGTYHRVTILDTPKGDQKIVNISLRSSRNEDSPLEDNPPKVGETVKGYVIHTNKKGCFVRLSRGIEGRSTLKELCDGFLPDPASSFPQGRLVAAKVKTVQSNSTSSLKYTVDLDMRESSVLGTERKVMFQDVMIGEKYKGLVSRLEAYGVFVRLDNSNVSGLCHKSECSDKYVKNLADNFDPGDRVKVLVIKKDEEKKTLGFSMKASHFVDDGESDDESTTDMSVEQSDAVVSDDDDDEMVDDDEASSESGSSAGSSSDSDSEDESVDVKKHGDESKDKLSAMDTDVGFDWDVTGLDKSAASDSASDSVSESSDDEDDAVKSSHKSRKKQALRRKEEQEIARRERALADGTADENPETASDFERLLAGQPNSSEIWIRYMAFHVSLADIEAARHVASRALDKIEFRQEGEKLNIWSALLALESKYGTDASLAEATSRACQHSNPKKVYLRLCEMVRKEADLNPSSQATEKADALFTKMCKKFKNKKTVWLSHAEYLLATLREEDAQNLLKKAVLSLPQHKHVETMSKFAQMVFEHGSPEKARTLFEGLLVKNSKRLDLLFVYADKEVKYGDIAAARALYRKVASPQDGSSFMKLSEKKMKHLFKKWYSFEEKHGSEETQEEVKRAARAYVDA